METITIILGAWCGFGGFMFVLHYLLMVISASCDMDGIDTDKYYLLRQPYDPSKTYTIMLILGGVGVVVWVLFCIFFRM